MWCTGSHWHKLIIWYDGSRLKCLSIRDPGMWRKCSADGGGSADGTLIKLPRECSRRTILSAIICITVASSTVGISQPAIQGMPWISCRTVLCRSESDSANRFERETGTMGLEQDASSTRSNVRTLVALDCLEGPGGPGLLSYSDSSVIESGILPDS